MPSRRAEVRRVELGCMGCSTTLTRRFIRSNVKSDVLADTKSIVVMERKDILRLPRATTSGSEDPKIVAYGSLSLIAPQSGCEHGK